MIAQLNAALAEEWLAYYQYWVGALVVHSENTASPRGSRVDGCNPEDGAPTLPTVEILREMMDEKDTFTMKSLILAQDER